MRNEVVHNKPAPLVEISVRFLQSYLDPIIGIKMNTNVESRKGKMVIARDQTAKNNCMPAASGATSRWRPPAQGWVKLNSDGSFVWDGEAGAGMIL